MIAKKIIKTKRNKKFKATRIKTKEFKFNRDEANN
jgi:hypothetical protein